LKLVGLNPTGGYNLVLSRMLNSDLANLFTNGFGSTDIPIKPPPWTDAERANFRPILIKYFQYNCGQATAPAPTAAQITAANAATAFGVGPQTSSVVGCDCSLSRAEYNNKGCGGNYENDC